MVVHNDMDAWLMLCSVGIDDATRIILYVYSKNRKRISVARFYELYILDTNARNWYEFILGIYRFPFFLYFWLRLFFFSFAGLPPTCNDG